MKKNFLTGVAVGLACLGTAVPHPVLAAGVSAGQVAPQSQIADVKLQGGAVSGHIVDSQGNLLSGSVVKVLSSNNQEVVSTVSTQDGKFTLAGLSSGVYRISTSQGQVSVRVWEGNAAPPSAKSDLLLVNGGPLDARAQQRAYNLFAPSTWSTTATIVTSAVIISAIAIPVAIHNSGSNNVIIPVSP